MEKKKKPQNHNTLNSHGIAFSSGLSYSSFTWAERVWWHPWVMAAGKLSQLDIVQQKETLGQFSKVVISKVSQSNAQATLGALHHSQRD